ncbi:MAG: NAD(P)-dependent oxidoreductase [Phenylobacterium sp.]
MAHYTVIGAGGFVGSAIVRALAADGHTADTPRRGDPALFDRELGRIFYCAGLTGDYRVKPFETVEAHVGLLADLMARGRFDRIVYLSSTRLYGASAEGREDQPLALDPNNPEHLYELTKALGENLVVTRSGGRGAAARLSYVFDWTPGATGFLSEWLSQASQRRALAVASSPSDARDYIHRDDAVAGLRAVLDSEVQTIVNVASGRATSNAEIAEIFREAGWQVAFERATGAPSVQALDVSRLGRLGVQARDSRVLIAEYLSGLQSAVPA